MKYARGSSLQGSDKVKFLLGTCSRLGFTMPPPGVDDKDAKVQRAKNLNLARSFALHVIRRTRGATTEKIVKAMKGTACCVTEFCCIG